MGKEPIEVALTSFYSLGEYGSMSDIWEAFLDLYKVPKDKVAFLNVGTARLEAFAMGISVGALGFAIDDIPAFQRMGVKNLKMFLFTNWEIPGWGDGVVTHVDTAKKNKASSRKDEM